MKLKYGPYSPSRLETASCGYEFQQSYIVKRPENKVLLKHLTDVGFEIKDENFQIDMLDTLDEKTILFYPKMISHSIQLFVGTQEQIEKIVATNLEG